LIRFISGVSSKEEDKCHLKKQRLKCGGRMKKVIDGDNACTLHQISNFLDPRAHLFNACRFPLKQKMDNGLWGWWIINISRWIKINGGWKTRARVDRGITDNFFRKMGRPRNDLIRRMKNMTHFLSLFIFCVRFIWMLIWDKCRKNK
jgi:hypothetical protein